MLKYRDLRASADSKGMAEGVEAQGQGFRMRDLVPPLASEFRFEAHLNYRGLGFRAFRATKGRGLRVTTKVESWAFLGCSIL